MKTKLVCLTILMTSLISGCDYSIDNSSDAGTATSYTNRIAVGTGMSGFSLSGQATTFYTPISSNTLYWKLESTQDYNSSALQIGLEKWVSGAYSGLTTANVSSATGHYALSGITVSSTGNYRITGYMVSPSVTVASATFNVQ